MRVTFVVLLMHDLIRPSDGVAAPTAPDMLSASAPAAMMTIGFRNRPTLFAIDDIGALKCMDPSRNKETMKKSCASHRGSRGAWQRQAKRANCGGTFDYRIPAGRPRDQPLARANHLFALGFIGPRKTTPRVPKEALPAPTSGTARVV